MLLDMCHSHISQVTSSTLTNSKIFKNICKENVHKISLIVMFKLYMQILFKLIKFYILQNYGCVNEDVSNILVEIYFVKYIFSYMMKISFSLKLSAK